jgi:PAS domain S-box-containing protein
MTRQKLISSFLSSFFRKDYQVYNSERIDKVKEIICDGVLMTLFVLSIPALISSLLRSFEIGIKPVFFAHTFVALIIWVTCLAILVKINVTYRFRASIVILAFYFIAVTSMLQFGLLAAASAWFIVVPALSVILFNTRAGLIMILLTIISFLVIATLDLNGFISLNVKEDGYVNLLLTWINYSIIYLLAGGVLFVAVSILKNSLMYSLSKTDSVAKELKLIIENAKKAGVIADAIQTAVNTSWLSIDFSPDGLILKANDNVVSYLGYSSSEDLVGKHHKIFCESDYIKSTKYNSFWKNLADGKQQAGEFKRIRKDGSEIWINANYTPVIDTDGKVFKIIKIACDISEMHKLRTASEAIAKELRQFIETANAPIFGIDSHGLVNEWNQTSEKITGFTKDEVLGKDLVQTYITENYQEAVKKVLDNALLGAETANYEFPLFTKGGERIMVLLNSSTRRNAAGEIIGVLGVGQDITEIDALRTASEAIAKELRQFIETANAPIFGIDSHGLVNEWNQTSEKITGFTKDEVLGKDLVQTYITENYQEAVKKVLDNALLGAETANYEFPLFTKDGQRIMVLLNSSTRRNAAGDITGVLGVGQDITEIDALRTASEAIAKELRQFIETANAPIFGIDSHGLVNEWNQTSEKITGFTKDEVLGKDLVQTYITEDYRKPVKQVFLNALKGKETANFEFPLFTKEGEFIMVLLNSSTRRNAAGEITGVLGVGQDITEIDALRTASEAIAKELRQFIETANAPIFGIDSHGLVNEWNQTSEKITGFTKDEVLGKDLVQTYITENYQEAVKKVLDNALLGIETANYEFPLFTKDGERVMVLLNSSTRRNAAGEITGVLGVGQDITELVGYRNDLELKVTQRTLKLKEALEKEKELNELKSRFVSTTSHEFRTPLAIINFAAGAIKKYWDKMEPAAIEEKLIKIEDQVLHMTALLGDILIFGQMEAGEISNKPLNLNLGYFICKIIEEVYSSTNKSHEILLIDNEGLKKADILIDEKLGRNIFGNLLSNAIKFSPDAKKITVELVSDKDNIIISITDYGIGILESDLKNIFKPFTRGENVDLIQGTGLGLTIVKEAVDLIGGEINVESSIGNGACFIVKIPKI